MKRMRSGMLGVFCLFLLSISLNGCGAARSNIIFKPESYRSPQLDFTKVQALAVMPVNAFTDEIPELTTLINDGLPAELRRAQTAWKVMDEGQVLRAVNDNSLGRGLQNYVADLNTYSSSVGSVSPNFTAETKAFFRDLKNQTKVEALLFATYGFSQQQGTQQCLVIYTCPATIKTLRVNVSLYDIASQRIWWASTLTLTGSQRYSNAELASAVLRGIANDFGKGALRQL